MGVDINLIAVFWGPERVDGDFDVDQRLKDYAREGSAVPFSNDTFGKDTWSGTKKSGVITYTHKDKEEILYLAGKEDNSYQFT
jgi:hypothetical protein